MREFSTVKVALQQMLKRSFSRQETQKRKTTTEYKPKTIKRMVIILFSSVAQSCPTLCNPMDCSTPGFPVLTNSWSLPKLMLMMPSNHLILCHPLLLLPSIFPSIKVISNESVLCIRCQNIGVSALASVLPMNMQD